jgi:hypothetical protein
MSRLLPLAGLVSLAIASSGCPSSAHRISKDQLMAMSQTPPEVRGEHVRVVQSLGDGDDPPEPAPPVEGGVHVVVFAPIWVGGSPRGHRHQPHVAGGGGGGGGGGASPGVASSKKDAGKAILVLAAIGALAGALTEGLRYDGYVRLHPMHPVHLWGPNGEYTWMALADVTPDVAAWADRAVVREEEGPWQPLGRRPLDRQGFTYSLLMGAGEVALIGDDPQPGFASHIDFGYYFVHQVGLQLDIAYAWADDDFGNTVFDGRYSLQLDVMPLSAGSFHAGGYGLVGLAYRSDDGIQHNDQDTVVGGGGLLQLELTTRMALTLRLGLDHTHDETLSELTGGLSIY